MRITSAPAITRSKWPDLVEENQLDVGRALDVGYIFGSARLTTRTRNGKSSVAMLDTVDAATGDTTNIRSDRPADRSDKRQAASPRTSQESIPLAFPRQPPLQ